ncbi:MAG: hypothetical protein E6G66_09230 [Actinobacteria bacterium]|nr:MAG: hypothetical protein E6G66_09230 [Actinomycetota bacterium]
MPGSFGSDGTHGDRRSSKPCYVKRANDPGPALFRSGWFVESLATQSLVIFVIRTRRVPFFRSRPSRMLTTATLAVVGIGMVLPLSPLSHALGFQPLPVGYFGALVAMVVAYLVLVEAAKLEFFRFEGRSHRVSQRVPNRRILRRAGRFTHGSPV